VFSHKMKQTESLHMEEFFNVKEPFYVLFFTSTNHISYYKRGNILIPVDYYNKFIYEVNKLFNGQYKVSVEELLSNKNCLRWNNSLNKYVPDIIISASIITIESKIRINFYIEFYDYDNWISSDEICPMDIRFLNKSPKVNYIINQCSYHNYIPTITNQNWSLSTHKLFPENIRKQIKEFVLIQFKFYRSKIPKDILF